jgi:hypothetical protein
MSQDEIRQRAEAFKKSIEAKRVTEEQVSQTIWRWFLAGTLTVREHDTLKDLVFGKVESKN